jgi:hypothetical protein
VKPYYDDGIVTLYLGDCRELVSWADEGDVLVSDSPYGMRLRSRHNKRDLLVVGDEDTRVRDEALQLWGPKPALMFGRWNIPKPAGVRALLVWDKGEHTGQGDCTLPWKPNTEEIYVIGRGFTARRRGSNVLRYPAPPPSAAAGRLHPTEKPLPLMRHLVGCCPPGVIIDPFAGSGSTLRAAKDLGRRAIGVEVVERYAEVAARRLGQEALDFGGAA